LKLYSEEAPSSGLNVVPKGDDLCEALLGRALPRFRPPTLHAESLERPLPEGDELDRARTAEIAEAIRMAWQRDRPVYPKRMVVEKTADEISGTRKELNVQIWEPDRLLTYVDMRSQPAILAVSDDVQRDQYSFDGAWRRTIRGNRSAAIETGDARRGYPSEDYPYLGVDFHSSSVVSDAVLESERLEIVRAAKIDDVRYRVDFAPFHAPEAPSDVEQRIEATVISWSAMLRSDLNWAPEELRLTEDIFYPAIRNSVGKRRIPERHERRATQRFERSDEYVMLVERLSEETDFRTRPIVTRERTLVTTEFNPGYNEAAFDPRTLDPVVWPGRRPLPFWRWYRVTFSIGLATFAFLIGRSAIVFFGRTRAAAVAADEPLAEGELAHGEKAEAATPGS
jgi:hypothetical protein